MPMDKIGIDSGLFQLLRSQVCERGSDCGFLKVLSPDSKISYYPRSDFKGLLCWKTGIDSVWEFMNPRFQVSQDYGKSAMELVVFIFMIVIFASLIWLLRKNRISNQQEIAHLSARIRLLEATSPIQPPSDPQVNFSRSK
jgi:hypothetical protein